jgi:glycine cleavage system H protein
MAQESYPEDLLYHPDHDWARIEPDGYGEGAGDAEATLGITWYAQEQLGEVVFFEAPDVGTVLAQGEPYAEVESVKAVSDVVAPLSGEIVAVNDALADTPGAINEDPYGEGWLVRIKLGDPAERERLLDAKAYSATLSG